MAHFRDVQSWIHDLAKTEVHPDAERLLQLGRPFEPQQLIEESTVQFLTELRDFFHEYARGFNAFSDAGQKFQEVKIYSAAQNAAEFMLFRNQMKLVVSNPAHGVIQISFTQHNRATLSVDGVTPAAAAAESQAQDLMAQIGPFRDVSWAFQGEKVTPEQVAKFYFSEFIRTTRDATRSKAGNQQLLQQIRALLQEKGLDL